MPKLKLFGLANWLRNSKKSVGFNSSKYKAIQKALDDLNSVMDKPITEENLQKAITAHEKLEKCCDKYLDSRSGRRKTSEGRARQEQVQILRDTNHLPNMEAVRDSVSAEEHKAQGKTVGDIISDYRIERVDISKKELETLGNAASSRIKFSHDGKNGVFTPCDGKIPKEQAMADVEKEFSEAELRFIKSQVDDSNKPYICSPDPEKTKLVAVCNEIGIERPEPGRLSNKQVDTLYRYFKAVGKVNTIYGKKEQLKLEPDTRMDSRNVATTQLATLLGVGDKIAKASPMVVQIKKEDGTLKDVEGTYMEFVEDAKDARSKEGIEFFLNTETDFNHPGLIRDTNRMQVLDFVSGQVDRHGGNLMYQGKMENGKFAITGLKGIDNDLSFGYCSITPEKTPGPLGSIEDIKQIDDDMLQKLTVMDESVIKRTFTGMITETNIKDMLERRSAVLDAVKDGKIDVVKDWNDPQAQAKAKSAKYYTKVKSEIEGIEKAKQKDDRIEAENELDEEMAEKIKPSGLKKVAIRTPKEQAKIDALKLQIAGERQQMAAKAIRNAAEREQDKAFEAMKKEATAIVQEKDPAKNAKLQAEYAAKYDTSLRAAREAESPEELAAEVELDENAQFEAMKKEATAMVQEKDPAKKAKLQADYAAKYDTSLKAAREAEVIPDAPKPPERKQVSMDSASPISKIDSKPKERAPEKAPDLK